MPSLKRRIARLKNRLLGRKPGPLLHRQEDPTPTPKAHWLINAAEKLASEAAIAFDARAEPASPEMSVLAKELERLRHGLENDASNLDDKRRREVQKHLVRAEMLLAYRQLRFADVIRLCQTGSAVDDSERLALWTCALQESGAPSWRVRTPLAWARRRGNTFFRKVLKAVNATTENPRLKAEIALNTFALGQNSQTITALRNALAALPPAQVHVAEKRGAVRLLRCLEPVSTDPTLVERERCFFLMATAASRSDFANGLEIYQQFCQHTQDRGVDSQFNKFLSRLISHEHTDGLDIDASLPLNLEHYWTPYQSKGLGLSLLTKSDLWRNKIDRDRIRRRLTAHAADSSIGRVTVISDTPKFVYPLLKAFSDSGIHHDFMAFDAVEEVYRSHRSLDLIYQPVDRYDNIRLRSAVLGNPLFRDVFTADTLFVDFANRAAVWASHIVRPHQKLFIRVHAYEAFSRWPYFINWGTVDGLIFVSEHIREIFLLEVGERVSNTPTVIIPNFKRMSPPRRPKAKPGRSLGMLGNMLHIKQPVQALEILAALHRLDSPKWRIRFAGAYWGDALSDEEAAHRTSFEHLRAQFRDPSRILLDGYQSDSEAWFGKIDFLLSCSLREGTHEAVNEAMYHGTPPVVRNWPLVSAYGGPGALYPPLMAGLLFDDAEEAAQLIVKAREDYENIALRLQEFAIGYIDNDRNMKTLLAFMREALNKRRACR